MRNKKKALGLLIATALLLPAVPVSAAEASSVGIVTGDQGLVTYTGPAEGQGQNGGTWSWDGAGTLTLNQYNGGRIYAEGDLTVILEGTNVIARQSDENNPNRPGLLVENGDLLITDDGQGEDSLSVAVGDYQENMRWGGAIRTHMGNLTIQGTSVSTDWNAYIRDGNLPSGSIFALGGNVYIRDSYVNAHVENNHNGTAAAIMASGYNNGMSIDSTEGGSVYIWDSQVEARADKINSELLVQTIYGIYAYSNIQVKPVIQISNSYVAAYGAGAPSVARAMYAVGREGQGEGPQEGKILIDEASTFPEGFYIEPYAYYDSTNVLTWWGEDAHYGTLYGVNYIYEGALPENAPALPETERYMKGETVRLREAPALEGYTFSGWTVKNLEVQDGTFLMPGEEVVVSGSWTKNPDPEKYQVSYQYEGEVPENAPAPPETAFYEEGETVTAALEPEAEGYTFSGWKTEDAALENGSFQMPAGAVVLTGSFEKIPEPVKTYEVIYKYEGKVPEKAPELPKTLSYEEGELVKTAEEPALEGYRFSGWKADNLETEDGAFRMPAETVTLRGSFEKIKPAATAAPSKAPSAAPSGLHTSSPGTGDPSGYLPAALCTLAAAGMSGLTVLKKRFKKEC